MGGQTSDEPVRQAAAERYCSITVALRFGTNPTLIRDVSFIGDVDNRHVVGDWIGDVGGFTIRRQRHPATPPADGGCSRSGVPDPWQAMHLAWPARLATKIGCTFDLKYSYSREGEAAC